MKKETAIIILAATQTACIMLTILGITIEVIYKADIGFLVITIGSLMFAITAKVETYLFIKRKE